MEGVKHLIECKCILPQMKNKNPIIFHSFVVFSVVKDDGATQEKFSQCNNCGVIHRVYDICKSEIMPKESHAAVQTSYDVSLSTPTELSNILTTYKCDISLWEHAQFIYENELWGEKIILLKENNESEVSGKFLSIEGKLRFKIEPFSFKESFDGK